MGAEIFSGWDMSPWWLGEIGVLSLRDEEVLVLLT